MSIHGGGRGGGRRRGALRGRQLALLHRRVAGVTVLPTTGGASLVGTVDTSGSGTSAIALASVGVLSAATTGASAAALTLRKIGVLAPATSGAGADAAALRSIAVLAPATTGRSTLALVLSDVGTLAVLTAGRSVLAAPLVALRVLVPATSGAGATAATMTAIRAFGLATAGAGAMDVSIGGGHGLLSAATTGASDVGLAMENGAATTPAPAPGGYAAFSWGRQTRRRDEATEAREARVLAFPLATRGASAWAVALARITPPTDPLDDWATIVLLLEAA